ncbi:uncharacterized membrane protein YjjP (DUF1212 family) [Variovorax sp. GrIS 2.14]|uniref:hypothetical protein n=1 Tax=Variovorax sp. GrIS 2.14 TaxID=3071709 RepID=UPI0038F72A33
MKNGYSNWARQHSRRMSAEELSTEFRELEREKRAAGWRRNMALFAAALAVAVVAVLLRYR